MFTASFRIGSFTIFSIDFFSINLQSEKNYKEKNTEWKGVWVQVFNWKCMFYERVRLKHSLQPFKLMFLVKKINKSPIIWLAQPEQRLGAFELLEHTFSHVCNKAALVLVTTRAVRITQTVLPCRKLNLTPLPVHVGFGFRSLSPFYEWHVSSYYSFYTQL